MAGLAGLMGLVGLVGRDAARQAARRELAKHVYAQARPGIVTRAVQAVIRFLQRLFTSGGGSGGVGGGSGALGYVLVIGLLVALAALVLWKLGPLRRARSADDSLDTAATTSAERLRAEADAHAAAGRWAEAVRARLRAVVRDLEDRAILDPRPGRTASEVASETARMLPQLEQQLWTAARVFGEIWYGRRRATAADDAAVAELDTALQRRQRLAAPAPEQTRPAVPA